MTQDFPIRVDQRKTRQIQKIILKLGDVARKTNNARLTS
jgi:hypothetical protein